MAVWHLPVPPPSPQLNEKTESPAAKVIVNSPNKYFFIPFTPPFKKLN
jgi:hypothetical protein